MKSKSDTFIFLWGGPLKSPALSQVLYWAVNEDGEVGGIVLPSSVWAMVEKALLSAEKDQVDYYVVTISGALSLCFRHNKRSPVVG